MVQTVGIIDLVRKNDMMTKRFHNYSTLLLLLIGMAYSPMALAYIGPGLGSGVVAAVLGIVAGLVMLVVGVVWYPLKHLIRKFKRK